MKEYVFISRCVHQNWLGRCVETEKVSIFQVSP